jgi:acetyl esterase/lipase
MRLGYRTLATRVARLEKRQRFRRNRQTVLYVIREAGEPVGMAAPGGTVARGWDEPLAALASRATAALGARFLWASYPRTPDPSNRPTPA